MNENKFRGRRAILLARVSTKTQAEYGIPAQIKDMQEFATREGIVVVGSIELKGKSGLKPEARVDIDQIVARKVEASDFDLVVVPVVDRLTRNGVLHAFWILFEFKRVGIELTCAKEDIPTDEHGWIVLGLSAQRANTEITRLLDRTHTSIVKAMLDGRLPHSHVTPYGVDRLYSTPEGAPLHRIRNLPDGRQIMLAPVEDEILRWYDKNESEKQSSHHKKHPTDRVTYVPGDPLRVEIVREIFYWYYVAGMTEYGITKELTRRNVESSTGRGWTPFGIRGIVGNATYLGEGYALRQTTSEVARRSKHCTLLPPLKLSKVGIHGQPLSRPTPKYLPQDDWLVVPYPHLINYLTNFSPNQRLEIHEKQKARYAELSRNEPSERSRKLRELGGDRHFNSSYFLKGILTCQNGTVPMRGKTLIRRKRKKKLQRWYTQSTARQYREKKGKSVYYDADLLEDEAIGAFRDAVKNLDELKSHARKVLLHLLKTDGRDYENERGILEREKKKFLKEIAMISVVNSDLPQDQVREMTAPFKRKLQVTQDRLAEITRKTAVNSGNFDELLANTVARLEAAHTLAKDTSLTPQLTSAIKGAIKTYDVNTTTRNIRLEFGLPLSPISTNSGAAGGCVVTSSRTCSYDHATRDVWLNFGFYQGKYVIRAHHRSLLTLRRVPTNKPKSRP